MCGTGHLLQRAHKWREVGPSEQRADHVSSVRPGKLARYRATSPEIRTSTSPHLDDPSSLFPAGAAARARGITAPRQPSADVFKIDK